MIIECSEARKFAIRVHVWCICEVGLNGWFGFLVGGGIELAAYALDGVMSVILRD
jgi:hypothetical protein